MTLHSVPLMVEIEKRNINLDGTDFPAKSLQALRWLQVLNDHRGDWIAACKLGEYDEHLDGVRTDQLKKYLPESVVKLIESKPGAGSRLKL